MSQASVACVKFEQVGLYDNGDSKPDYHDAKRKALIEENLFYLAKTASIARFCVYPNFDYHRLYGPAGFATSIWAGSPFNDDVLATSALFRVVSFAEVPYNSQLLKKFKSAEYRNVIRKCIPLVSPNPPTLEDTTVTSWCPELGMKGASVGFYIFKDRIETSDDSKPRLFVGVHSGLPGKTLELLWHKLHTVAHENRKLGKSSTTMEGLSGAASQTQKLETFDTMFGPGSIMERMRALAVENNRRLTAIFCSAMDLTPMQAPIADMRYLYSSNGISLTSDQISSKKALMAQALEWWPRHSPVYPFSIVPHILPAGENPRDVAPEVAAILPPPILRGFPIGKVAEDVKNACKEKKEDEKFANFCTKNALVYKDVVESAHLDVYSDYNSFRYNGHNVCFYSNCTSTTKVTEMDSHNCVIRQHPLAVGYECFGSLLPHSASKRAPQQHWTNRFLNGYPSCMPVERDEDRAYTLGMDTLEKFFSVHEHGMENKKFTPEQLKTVLKRKLDLKAGQMRTDLCPGDECADSIMLEPEFVYVSPELPFEIFHLS